MTVLYFLLKTSSISSPSRQSDKSFHKHLALHLSTSSTYRSLYPDVLCLSFCYCRWIVQVLKDSPLTCSLGLTPSHIFKDVNNSLMYCNLLFLTFEHTNKKPSPLDPTFSSCYCSSSQLLIIIVYIHSLIPLLPFFLKPILNEFLLLCPASFKIALLSFCSYIPPLSK